MTVTIDSSTGIVNVDGDVWDPEVARKVYEEYLPHYRKNPGHDFCKRCAYVEAIDEFKFMLGTFPWEIESDDHGGFGITTCN